MAISTCISLSAEDRINTKTDDEPFRIDETGCHGTEEFPAAIYLDDVTKNYVNWHWHREFEIGFVTEGSVTVRCGNRKYFLDRGDIFFVNSDILHSMHNGCPLRPSIFKSIAFDGSIVSGQPGSVFSRKYLLPVLDNPHLRSLVIRTDNGSYRKIFPLLTQIWNTVDRELPDYEIAVRNDLSELFRILIHLPEIKSGEGQKNAHAFLQEKRVQTLMDYMHLHYQEKITLNDLAKAASVSKTETLRCFKAIIGQSPIQYLRYYRLQRAAYLLRHTDDPIGDICANCGFEDNSYFSKVFREFYHCSPHDYRWHA